MSFSSEINQLLSDVRNHLARKLKIPARIESAIHEATLDLEGELDLTARAAFRPSDNTWFITIAEFEIRIHNDDIVEMFDQNPDINVRDEVETLIKAELKLLATTAKPL